MQAILPSASLRFRSEATDLVSRVRLGKFRFVLGRSAVSSLSPHLERIGRHLAPHQLDDFTRRQAELQANGIKTGSVLPRHHDDAVDLASR